MSEEQGPPDRPTPEQFQTPRPLDDASLRAAATQRPNPRDVYMAQAQGYLQQLGINNELAIKVLIIAAASGVVAALLDRILGLPAGGLAFTFGWIIAALNGASYAFYNEHHTPAGLVMAAITGAVTLLLWFIVLELIGREPQDFNRISQAAVMSLWFDELNVLKVLLTGIVVGMLGFGWFALLRRLPAKFIP